MKLCLHNQFQTLYMYFACNAMFYMYYIFLYRCQGFYLRLTNKYVCEAIIRFHNIRIWNYFFSDTTRWNAEFLVIQRYLIVLWLFSLTYLFCVYFVIYKDMLIPRVYTILNIYKCFYTYTCTLHKIIDIFLVLRHVV